MNADGHEPNAKQEVLSQLMQDYTTLFAITPAHLTAKGCRSSTCRG